MKYTLLLILILFLTESIKAQHEHHSYDTIPAAQIPEVRTNSEIMDSLSHMTHAFSTSLPMNRNGSGTSWSPDETPIYAVMLHGQYWNFMLHGNVFIRYTNQNLNNPSKRSADKFDAPNWIMAMGQRRIGARGLLYLSAMFSAERLTEGGAGYPLLFQTGESWQGKALIDRQHPHDVFSELAIGYTHRINENTDIYGYFGFPGEPALGPPVAMHRISAMNLPDAPISHHWQDATHITFGVATAGFRYRIFKIESSRFTGREPDENRYTFDKPTFDSWSYRISANPNKNFSFQFSQGYLNSPESLEPGENTLRTTASMLYSKIIEKETHYTATIAYGANKSHGHLQHSYLLENNLQIRRTAIYGRYESVDKRPVELGILVGEPDKYLIQALTLGSNYQLFRYGFLSTMLGLQGTVNFIPPDLDTFYGKMPISVEVYLRLSPSLM